jgi:CDP-paratose 2-epimerase
MSGLPKNLPVAPAKGGLGFGVVEWFRPGQQDAVERTLSDLAALGVRRLRTGISWADWHTEQGQRWYDWLFTAVGTQLELLPCVLYTPPSLGLIPSTAAPPRVSKDYADFIDLLITRYGDRFQWIELWNEPNNLSDWDWRIDPGWYRFSEMIGAAAYWARQRGKCTVLAGMAPCDPHWLGKMCERGVMAHIDAVGIHGFPGTWEFDWKSWPDKLAEVRAVLERHGCHPELWITETGYSTWNHDERGQIEAFCAAMNAPADRIYWYGARDLDPELPTQDGLHTDVRHYHMGLRRADGTPKLLYRLLADDGMEAVHRVLKRTARRAAPGGDGPALITGGAGFIGCNLAHRLLEQGRTVRILDNLSRPGSERNLHWLGDLHGERFEFMLGDVRNRMTVRDALRGAREVYHLAAQVAVTTSLDDPGFDSDVNIGGTLNVLEELRRLERPPGLLFTSTNKVYGALDQVQLALKPRRYEPADLRVRRRGIGEGTPLSFCSPYGCSKGSADQYVLDYARHFGLPALVFRMSCIYGPRQFGNEDQGWVAHFIKTLLAGHPLTLYGDGRQVRDLLYVDDLMEAMLLAQCYMGSLSGRAYNIGGGPGNARSLLEVVRQVEQLLGRRAKLSFQDWRPADQRYYVSDVTRYTHATGWRPRVGAREGVLRLYDWLSESEDTAGVKDVRGAAVS